MKEKIKSIKKEQIMILAIGLLLGILIMLIFYPERIAKLKNGEERVAKVSSGEITADDVYNELKDKYASSVLLDLIDEKILNKKYKLTDEETEELKENVDNYLKSYTEYYSKSEEEILKQLGFENKEEFTTYMELDYKRNKYFKEYVGKRLTEKEIEDYYTDSVFADSKVEHILVKVDSNMTETEAQEKAQEILDKLDDGDSWTEVKAEYASFITNEEFDISFDSNIEPNFLKGVYGLEEGTYSKQLVRTSYGYHIIYRKEILKEKESLKELTPRIKEVLINKKRQEDSNLYETVMIEMRKDAKLKISDTKLEKSYNEYIKKYEE